MSDTGVRVTQLFMEFASNAAEMVPALGGVVQGLKNIKAAASETITNAITDQLAASMGVFGAAAVKAGVQNQQAAAQTVGAWDKVFVAARLGEEKIRQAELQSSVSFEKMLSSRNDSMRTFVRQQVEEYEAGNRRILSDMKVTKEQQLASDRLLAAERKGIREREQQEEKADRERRQQEEKAERERLKTIQRVTQGLDLSRTPAEMERERFKLWGSVSPSGRQNAQFGMNTRDAEQQLHNLNEAMHQGQLIQIQMDAAAFDRAEATRRTAAQQVVLNEALGASVGLRQRALDLELKGSETLRQKVEGEQRITHELTEQEKLRRFYAATAGLSEGGLWGGAAGSGPPPPPTPPRGPRGPGETPGWPGPPGMGGGIEGALRTISWGGGIGATVGRLNPAIGAGIVLVTNAIEGLATAAGGLFSLFTNVGAKALDVVFEGFKLLLSPITGFFGMIGSLKDGAAGFFGELTKGVLTLGLAYVGVQSVERALKSLIETTIGFNAQLETNHTALALVMKDQQGVTDRAGDIQTVMQQVAIDTTFGFEAVQRATRELMQGGISVGAALGDDGLLGVVLDVGASMGTLATGAIDRLTLALGQVQQAGHLTGEEMRQIRNAGVSLPEVFAVISRQTGITVAKLQEMQVQGTLTAKMFFAGFKEWGKLNFGGLAAEQAKTFTGALQQIQEAVKVVASRAVKPGFDLMSQALQNFAALVRGPEMLSFAAELAGRFQAIIDGVMKVVEGFRNGFGYILSIVQTTGRVIYNALQWINPFATHSPSLVDSVEDGVQRIINSYARLGREIPASVEPLANAMTSFRERMSAGFGNVDEGIFAANTKALSGLGPGAPEAYRAVQLAIRDLKDEAAGLTPEIIAQTNEVRNLTAEQKGLKIAVEEADLAVKEAKDGQREMVDEIKGHRTAITLLNADLLEAKRIYRDWAEENLKPVQDQLDKVNLVLNVQEMELQRWQIALRQGEEGLIDLRTASTAASDHLAKLQDQLNLSKDALGGINDQLRLAKAGLKDVLETPLAGTNKYADQIAHAQEVIAKLQEQVATRKFGGANEASMKSLNAQLDRAQASLHMLEARKKIEIDIPEAKLKRLSESGGVEIGFADKEAQVRAATAMISPLEQAARIQQGRVDSQEALVRGAQQEAHHAKEALDLRNESLDPLRHQVTQAEQLRDHTKLTKEYLQNQLDILKLQGQPLEDNVTAIETAKNHEQEMLDLVTARLEKDTAERIQPLLDKQEEVTREYDAQNIILGKAKETLDEIKTAQGDLVTLAQSWQSEIDGALSKAKEFLADQERAAAEAKRLAKEAGGGKLPTEDLDRLAGADEALAKAKAQREQLARETALAKGNMAEWMNTWQETINTSLPWIGGFFGRLTGFVAGTSEAMEAAAQNDFPKAKKLFFETLQDVAQGLPEQLADWTFYFIKWVDEVGIEIVRNLGTMVDDMFAFLTGPAIEELDGGLTTWENSFQEWVIPAAKQLMENMLVLGTDLDNWVTNQAPVYEKRLEAWIKEFQDWVKPIWEPLQKALGDLVIGPLGRWIGGQVKQITEWVVTNWVTPFVQWVFEDPKGLWKTFEPELIRFIWAIHDIIVGEETDDPMKKATKGLGEKIVKGFMDVAGTIAHEVWSALMDAMGKWIWNHKVDILRYLYSPLILLAQIMGETVGKEMGGAIFKVITDFRKGAMEINPKDISAQAPGRLAELQNATPPPPPNVGQTLSVPWEMIPQEITVPELHAGDAPEAFVGEWNDDLGIASPSKVFQEMGRNVASSFTSTVDKTMAEWKSPFGPAGEYFSAGAGQTVNAGFGPRTGARHIEDEPWFIKWTAMFNTPEAPPAQDLRAPGAPAKLLNYNPWDMLRAGAEKWTAPSSNMPEKPSLQKEGGSGDYHRTFDYGEGTNTDITLVVQDSIIVGKAGMEEFAGITIQALARDARFRKLWP